MESEISTSVQQKYKVRLPYLHDGQKLVAQSNSRFKVLSAGRRWGKTRLGVWLCLEKAWNGGRAWWIAPTYAMALEGWKDLRNIGIEYGTEVKESEKTIITPVGGSVSIRSADNPDRLRGAGLDFVVLDECAFMKSNTWAEVVRPTLTERQGGALFISTPKGFNWFEKLYHDAQSLEDWESWQLPSSSNPFVPLGELEIARQEIGSYLFSQEYEAKFVELSGGIFKEDWFKYFTTKEITIMGADDNYQDKIQHTYGNNKKVFDDDLRKIATVDLATTTKETSDYTVICVIGITPENDVLVLDMIRQRLEAPDIIPLLRSTMIDHKLDYIGVERAGFQIALIQLARREGITIKELKADRDKITRAMPLSAKMEGGQIYFKRNAKWVDDLQRELLQFPEAEHDDQVDALAYSIVEINKARKFKAY